MKKILLCTFLFFTVSIKSKVLQSTLSESEKQLLESSQPLNDIFSLMYGPKSHYYKKLTPQEIKEGMEEACQALSHRDPHSIYLTASECKLLSEKMVSHFCGVGVVVPGALEEESEYIPIIELVPNGPADKSGIKSGDKIVQIDDFIVKGMKLEEAMSKLKGEKGSNVTLKIIRANTADPLDITITRDIIKDEIALSFYIEKYNIYYLLLSIFSEKAPDQVKNVLETAYKKGSKAIIIDLRNNTGGLFDAAIDIAGLFLPKGSLVATTRDRNNKIIESWKTSENPIARKKGISIFFIVNNYTASSAEILTGSLHIYSQKLKPKDDLHVFVVGTETFGKGSVQEVIPLNGNSALKMTTALYYLPYDTCVQGKGITPDFIIESYTPPSDTTKWMQSQFGRDSVLKKHIKPHEPKSESSKNKKNTAQPKEIPWKEKRQDLLAQDFILQNTINLINLLELGKKAFPEMISHKEQVDFLHNNYVIGEKLSLTETK